MTNFSVIDSHCHLDYSPIIENLDDIISNANAAGVAAMIAISTKVKNVNNLKSICQNHNNIGYTVGTHPHNASEEKVSADELISLCDEDNLVGIGESGLDYHYNFADIKDQEESFLNHITAAQQTKLPLVIHSRDADDHMASILRKTYAQKPFSAVLHCFSGGKSLAECAVELGFYVSASGIITFKNAQVLRDIFNDIPKELLLVETDSPYLAPMPYRGKTNEPAYVVHTARKLAEIHSTEFSEFAEITRNNTLRLFPRLKQIIV